MYQYRNHRHTEKREKQDNPISDDPLPDYDCPIYHKPQWNKNQKANDPVEQAAKKTAVDASAMIHIPNDSKRCGVCDKSNDTQNGHSYRGLMGRDKGSVS